MNTRCLLLFLLIIAFENIPAQTYRAKMRLENLYWYQYIDNSPEWRYDLYADLYLGDELVTTGEFWYYDWKKVVTDTTTNPYWVFVDSTISNHFNGDGQVGMTVYRYVEIKGDGFDIRSDTIKIEFNKQRVRLNVLAKLQNGDPLSIDYLHLFTDPGWVQPHQPGYFAATLQEPTAIKFEPYYLSQYSQKFNHWNNNNEILNFYNYTPLGDSLFLIAHLSGVTKNVSIQLNFPEYTNAELLGFKDPWLVDTLINDNLGMRNRGMDSALFKYYNEIDFSDPSFDDYKGVFLNQSVNSGVYYSVRAPLNPTINGSPAIFLGWDYSGASLDYGHYADGYDTAPVVFTSNGATITADYTYDTISRDVTLASGTYNIAGTLTVNSGVTLTVNSGTTLNFPSGGGLVVNGTLTANGGTFTSNSSDWAGITLNDAEGSTIHNLTISKALAPIKINNTSDVSISGCIINNSSFYDGNYNSAIQVSNSTPTISLTTISGQGNSQNGITFYNGSGDYFFNFSC